jgi:hypothetical protein
VPKSGETVLKEAQLLFRREMNDLEQIAIETGERMRAKAASQATRPLPGPILVDAADERILSEYKWWPQWNEGPQTYYATAHARLPGSRAKVSLHRLLLNARPGQQIDHRNGNGLDNRRSNLRPATPPQNAFNTRSRRGSSSIFRGVNWHTARSKWQVGIRINNRRRHLGYFANEAEAGLEYDVAARLSHGEFYRPIDWEALYS